MDVGIEMGSVGCQKMDGDLIIMRSIEFQIEGLWWKN